MSSADSRPVIVVCKGRLLFVLVLLDLPVVARAAVIQFGISHEADCLRKPDAERTGVAGAKSFATTDDNQTLAHEPSTTQTNRTRADR
jgi:hypothetical protein